MEEDERTRPPTEEDSAKPGDEPLDPVVGKPEDDDRSDEEEAERSREGSPRPE